MAKSIYDVLNDLVTETSVPAIKDSKGKVLRESYGDVEHTIPRELLPTAEQFESEDELLEWAQDNDCLHSCLQKGIQKFLIEIRATFKAMKKDDEWTESYGQDNVDSLEWKITKRPNQGGSKAAILAKLQAGLDMAKAMKLAGLTDELIMSSLTPVYGEDGAASIMDEIAE